MRAVGDDEVDAHARGGALEAAGLDQAAEAQLGALGHRRGNEVARRVEAHEVLAKRGQRERSCEPHSERERGHAEHAALAARHDAAHPGSSIS